MRKPHSQFYSVRQVSEASGLKIPKILKMIKQEKIKAEKIDWVWLIPQEEMTRLKEEKIENNNS